MFVSKALPSITLSHYGQYKARKLFQQIALGQVSPVMN